MLNILSKTEYKDLPYLYENGQLSKKQYADSLIAISNNSFQKNKLLSVLFYEKLCFTIKKLEGKKSRNFAQSIHDLAKYHGFLENDYAEKSMFLDKLALKIRLKNLPKNDLDIAKSYNNISNYFHDKNDFINARQYIEKANKIIFNNTDFYSPIHRIVHRNMYYIYFKESDFSSALTLAKKIDKNINFNNTGATNSLIQLSKFLLSKGGKEFQTHGLIFYPKIIELAEKNQYPNSNMTFIKGAYYTGQMNQDLDIKALENFLKFKEEYFDNGLVKIPNSYYFTLINNISILYDKIGDLEKATEYRKIFYDTLFDYDKKIVLNQLDLAMNLAKLKSTCANNQYLSILNDFANNLNGFGFYREELIVLNEIIKFHLDILDDHTIFREKLDIFEQKRRKLINENDVIYADFLYSKSRFYSSKNAHEQLHFVIKAKTILEDIDSTCYWTYNLCNDKIIESYTYNRNKEKKYIENLIFERFESCMACTNFSDSKIICKAKKLYQLNKLKDNTIDIDIEIYSLYKNVDSLIKLNEFLPSNFTGTFKNLVNQINSDTLKLKILKNLSYCSREYWNTSSFINYEMSIIEIYLNSGNFELANEVFEDLLKSKDVLNKKPIKRSFAINIIIANLRHNQTYNLDVAIKILESLKAPTNYVNLFTNEMLIKAYALSNQINKGDSIIKKLEINIINQFSQNSVEYSEFLEAILRCYERHSKSLYFEEKLFNYVSNLKPSNFEKEFYQITSYLHCLSQLNQFQKKQDVINKFEKKYDFDIINYIDINFTYNLESSLSYSLQKWTLETSMLLNSSDKFKNSDFEQFIPFNKKIQNVLTNLLKKCNEKSVKLNDEEAATIDILLFSSSFFSDLSELNTLSASDFYHGFNKISAHYKMNNDPYFKEFNDGFFVDSLQLYLQLIDDIDFSYSHVEKLNDSCYNFLKNKISDVFLDVILLNENESINHKIQIDRVLNRLQLYFNLASDPLSKTENKGIILDPENQKKLSSYKENINNEIFELYINKENIITNTNRELASIIKNDSSLLLIKNEINDLKKTIYFDRQKSTNDLPFILKQKERVLRASLIQKINSPKWLNINSIKKNLNENEAFIFINSNPSSIDGGITVLNFYLVFNNSKYPEIIKVKRDELENELFHEYAKNTFRNKTLRMINPTGKYYKDYWNKVADKLKDKSKLYISVDGVYNKLNIATFYNEKTSKYLFEEKDIEIVNSVRSFIDSKSSKKEYNYTNTAVLFGNPNYDSNVNLDQLEESRYFANSRDISSLLKDTLNRGGRVRALPGTKLEVDYISKTLNKNNWSVSLRTNNNASENALKNIKSPRVLHLATHGYFLEDIKLDQNSNKIVLGMNSSQVFTNPLLRSGLFFAGVNKTLNNQNVGGDGILTAYEASLLNLKNTELVVLSACETARGELKNGEGVYGLRKAIFDAGANNVMMSLWKVDDKVTQEFMTTFYTYWLEDKMSIREAFKATRSFIKSKYPQPYYWGAFILVSK